MYGFLVMCHLFWNLCWYWWVFVFKHKTADEMRISDWSSDVCSSYLRDIPQCQRAAHDPRRICVPTGRARQDRGNEAAVDPWQTGYAARAAAFQTGRAPSRERVCQ